MSHHADRPGRLGSTDWQGPSSYRYRQSENFHGPRPRSLLALLGRFPGEFVGGGLGAEHSNTPAMGARGEGRARLSGKALMEPPALGRRQEVVMSGGPPFLGSKPCRPQHTGFRTRPPLGPWLLPVSWPCLAWQLPVDALGSLCVGLCGACRLVLPWRCAPPSLVTGIRAIGSRAAMVRFPVDVRLA